MVTKLQIIPIFNYYSLVYSKGFNFNKISWISLSSISVCWGPFKPPKWVKTHFFIYNRLANILKPLIEVKTLISSKVCYRYIRLFIFTLEWIDALLQLNTYVLFYFKCSCISLFLVKEVFFVWFHLAGYKWYDKKCFY